MLLFGIVAGCHRHNTFFERKFEESGNGLLKDGAGGISGVRADRLIGKC
jgi:hypothetical protein